jgi:hypothetical protein
MLVVVGLVNVCVALQLTAVTIPVICPSQAGVSRLTSVMLTSAIP